MMSPSSGDCRELMSIFRISSDYFQGLMGRKATIHTQLLRQLLLGDSGPFFQKVSFVKRRAE